MSFFSRKPEPGLYPEIDRELWVDMLLRASAQGSVSAVRALVDRGLSVDEKNDVGFTPLMAAARSYQFEVVRFLLERGADVHRSDVYGHSVLHCAVMSPTRELETQAQCVRAILGRYPILDAQDESGCTPLMHAAWFGLEPSVLLLVNAGADQGVRDQKGRTAAMLALERKHEAIARMLGQKKAEPVARANGAICHDPCLRTARAS